MTALNYNPDVLDALANLSSDEVFTPPKLVNQILDLLPQDMWSDSSITMLDPCSKSWVFLREAAKRFIKGLEKEFPDLQERLDHIFTKQLFGIAITELTSLLSRRWLYCAKHANGKYSICSQFDNKSGNIRYARTQHNWKNGSCQYCGASEDEYSRSDELETHAYKFIHTDVSDIPLLFSTNPTMKFDVIIGNPPYQLSDWWAQASAKPLYHHFVEQAKKLNPSYLSMIIPSRRFTWGKWLDQFRSDMVQDKRMKALHDFFDAKECFPWVDIKGWVCYFLREKNYHWPCAIVSHENWNIVSSATRYLQHNNSESFIRYNEAISILEKVQSFKEPSFSKIVSSRKPFWFATNFTDFVSKEKEWYIKIYANKKQWFVKKDLIDIWKEYINSYKVFVPYAVWSWESKEDQIKPFVWEPWSCCTETYLVIWTFKTETEAINVCWYIKSKFLHFLVTLLKNTQHATSKVYQYVPLQDFTQSRTDEKLYAKYRLSQEEIDFIEGMIRPMD